jgi:DSF synthase
MLYGLFPGMGAYSFLLRRLGQARAATLITGGRPHAAQELHEMGLHERVLAQATGRTEMRRQIARIHRRVNASLAIYTARRRTCPITFQEMADIVEDWVSVAMRLTDNELRRMHKLSSAQQRLRATHPADRNAQSA